MDLFDVYRSTQKANIGEEVKQETGLGQPNDLMETFRGITGYGLEANENGLFVNGQKAEGTETIPDDVKKAIIDREEARKNAIERRKELVEKYGDGIDILPEVKNEIKELDKVIANPDLQPSPEYAKALDQIVQDVVSGGTTAYEMQKEGLAPGAYATEAFRSGEGIFDAERGNDNSVVQAQMNLDVQDKGNIVDALKQGTYKVLDTVMAPFRNEEENRKEEALTERSAYQSAPMDFLSQHSAEYFKKYGVAKGTKKLYEDLVDRYGYSALARIGSEGLVMSAPTMIASLAAASATGGGSLLGQILGTGFMGTYTGGKVKQHYEDQEGKKDLGRAVATGIVDAASDLLGAEIIVEGLTKKLISKGIAKSIAKKAAKEASKTKAGLALATAGYIAGVLGDIGLEVTEENVQNFVQNYGKTGNIEKALELTKEQAPQTTIATATMAGAPSTLSGTAKFAENIHEGNKRAEDEGEKVKIEKIQKLAEKHKDAELDDILDENKRDLALFGLAKKYDADTIKEFVKENIHDEKEQERLLSNLDEIAQAVKPESKEEQKQEENVDIAEPLPQEKEKPIDIEKVKKKVEGVSEDLGGEIPAEDKITTNELPAIVKIVKPEDKKSVSAILQKIQDDEDRDIVDAVLRIEPTQSSGSQKPKKETGIVHHEVREDILNKFKKGKTAQNESKVFEQIKELGFRLPAIAFKKLDISKIKEPIGDVAEQVKSVINAKNNEEAVSMAGYIKNPVARNVALELYAEKKTALALVNKLQREHAEELKEHGDPNQFTDGLRKSIHEYFNTLNDELFVESRPEEAENHTTAIAKNIIGKAKRKGSSHWNHAIAMLREVSHSQKANDIELKIAKAKKELQEYENYKKEVIGSEALDEQDKKEFLADIQKDINKKRSEIAELEKQKPVKPVVKPNPIDEKIKKLLEAKEKEKSQVVKDLIDKKIETLKKQKNKKVETENTKTGEVYEKTFKKDKLTKFEGNDWKILFKENKPYIKIGDEPLKPVEQAVEESLDDKEKLEKLKEIGLVYEKVDGSKTLYKPTKSGMRKAYATHKNGKIKKVEAKMESGSLKEGHLVGTTKHEIDEFLIDKDIEKVNYKLVDVLKRVEDKLLLNRMLNVARDIALYKIYEMQLDIKKFTDKELYEATLKYGMPQFIMMKGAIGNVLSTRLAGKSFAESLEKYLDNDLYMKEAVSQEVLMAAIESLIKDGFINATTEEVEVNGRKRKFTFYTINKVSPDMLERAKDYLFESGERIFEPPTLHRYGVIPKVKGTNIVLSDENPLVKAFKRYSAMVRFKMPEPLMKSVLNNFDEDDIAEIFSDGFVTRDQRLADESMREKVKRDFNNIKEFFESNGEKPFRYRYKIGSNYRPVVDTTIANYQTDKVARALVVPEKKIKSVKFTSQSEAQRYFYKMFFEDMHAIKNIAFNFGVKIDRLTDEQIKEELHKIFKFEVETVNGIPHLKAIKSKGMKGFGGLSKALQFAEKALALGGSSKAGKKEMINIAKEHEKMLTVVALRDIGMINAIISGKYDFKESVGLYAKSEADATTSATVLTRLNFGVRSSIDVREIASGGVTTSISETINELIQQFGGSALIAKGQKAIKDIYELAKVVFLLYLDKEGNKKTAIKLVKNMSRNQFKKFIQSSEYGMQELAAIRGITAQFEEGVLEQLKAETLNEFMKNIDKNEYAELFNGVFVKIYDENGRFEHYYLKNEKGKIALYRDKKKAVVPDAKMENVSIDNLREKISKMVFGKEEELLDEGKKNDNYLISKILRKIIPAKKAINKYIERLNKHVNEKIESINEPEIKDKKELKKIAEEHIGGIGFGEIKVFPFKIELEGKYKHDGKNVSFIVKGANGNTSMAALQPRLKPDVIKVFPSLTHAQDALIFAQTMNHLKHPDLMYIYDATMTGYDDKLVYEFSNIYNRELMDVVTKNPIDVAVEEYLNEKDENYVAFNLSMKEHIIDKLDLVQNLVYSPEHNGKTLGFVLTKQDREKLKEQLRESYKNVVKDIAKSKNPRARGSKEPLKYMESKEIGAVGLEAAKNAIGKISRNMANAIDEALNGNENVVEYIVEKGGIANLFRQYVKTKDEYTNHLVDMIQELETSLLKQEHIKLVVHEGSKFSVGQIEKQGDQYTIELALSDHKGTTEDVEVFAHELLHIVMDNTIPLSGNYRRKINLLIKQTIKHLKKKYGTENEYKAFLPENPTEEDIEMAKNIADYVLFGEGARIHEAEFLIYTLTNRNFMKSIDDMTIKSQVFEIEEPQSYVDVAINLIKKIINFVYRKVRKDKKAKQVAVKMYKDLALAYRRLGAGMEAKYAFYPRASIIMRGIDITTKLLGKTVEPAIETLKPFAEQLVVQPAVNLLVKLWKDTEIYRDMIDNESLKAFMNLFKFNRDVYERELYRIKSIAQSKKENVKEKVKSVYTKVLMEKLKNYDNDELRKLNRVLLSSGLFEYAEDKNEFNDLVNNIDKHIEKLYKRIPDADMVAQIEGLAELKRSGRIENHAQMMNAHNIWKQYYKESGRRIYPEVVREDIKKLVTLLIARDDIELVNKDFDTIFNVARFYKGMHDEFKRKNRVLPEHEIHGYIKEQKDPYEEYGFSDEPPAAATITGEKFIDGKRYYYYKIKNYTQGYTQGALGIKDLSMFGSKVDVEGKLTKERHLQDDGTYALLPIVNGQGKIVGWRSQFQSIDKRTIAENIAYTISDMYLRYETNEINKQIIDALTRDYEANKNRKKFIKIAPNNEEYEHMWMMIPKETRDYISLKTGERALYVRPEMVYDIFGYREPYVLRNRRQLVWLQKIVKDLVGIFKTKVTVLNPDTIMSNALSNYDTLIKYGMSPADAARRMKEAWFMIDEYESDFVKALELYYKRINGENVSQKEYEYYIKRKDSNPISVIYKEGMMTPIVDEVNVIELENRNIIRDAFENKFLSKLSKKAQMAIKSGYPTEDTLVFKMGLKMFQRGDAVAKYALYTYLVEQGYSKHDAIEIADEAFVNYAITEHPMIKYLNDMGGFMFSKYVFQSWKALVRLLKIRFGRFVTTEALQGFGYGYEEATDMYLHRNIADIVQARVADPINVAGTVLMPTIF